MASKRKACEEVGFVSRSYDLPMATSEAELLALIDSLNEDTEIDGILIQLPLPNGIDNVKVWSVFTLIRMWMVSTHITWAACASVRQNCALVPPVAS